MNLRKLDRGPIAALVPFAAILAFYSDFIPVWDGLIYAECIVGALLRGAPSELNCATHLSMAAFAPMALVQLPSPGSPALLMLGNALWGLVALVSFHGIVRAAFPAPERRLERVLLTAAMGVVPSFLACAINTNPDFALTALLMAVLRVLLEERYLAAAVWGTLLCFSKEPGIAHYLLAAGLHALVFATRPPGTTREKLRALAGRWPLLLPVAALALYAIVKARAEGPVVWTDTAREPLLHRLLTVRLMEPRLHDYLEGIFVFGFTWVASAFVAAAFAVGAFRLAFGLPPPQRDNPRAMHFLQLELAAVVFLVTRYLTFFNVRYVMPAVPLLLLVFFGSLGDLVRSAPVRRTVVGGLAALFALSAFRTVDPLTIRLRGTFAFGEHRMLNMREPDNERHYYGRDEIVYNVEFTEFHYLQNEVYRALKPDADRVVYVPLDQDWFFVGRIDPREHRRTLKPLHPEDRERYGPSRAFGPPPQSRKRPATVELDGYVNLEGLVNMQPKPRTVYVLAFPNVDATRDVRFLEQLYARVVTHRFEHRGYAVDVHEMRLKSAR